MLRLILLTILSTITILANTCTLNLTPNTLELSCDNKTLNITIQHDQQGNIATKIQTINNNTFTTTYTYNNQNKLTSKTLPSNKTIEYSYNQRGELDSISIDSQPYITDIQTNQNGLTIYTYADNQTHTREYDTNGRVTKLIYPNYTEEITYNAVSNITQLTNNNNKS